MRRPGFDPFIRKIPGEGNDCHTNVLVWRIPKNVLSMGQVCYSNNTEQKQQEKGLHHWCLESSGTSFCVISLLGLHWHTLSYIGSETQGHVCGSPRSRSRHWSISFLVRISWFRNNHLFSVSSHGKVARELS